MELNEKYSLLEIKDEINKTFYYKPTGVAVAVLIVGILMIASITVVQGLWIIGIFMLLISISVLIFLKDRKVLSICEHCLIVYNPRNQNEGRVIEWDEIVEWKALASGGNEKASGLLLLLENDEVVYAEMFGAFQISRVFRNKLPKQESSKVQISKIKNTPLSWFNKKG